MRKILGMTAISALLLTACSSGDEAAAPADGGGAAPGPGYTVLAPAELQQMIDNGGVYLVNVHVPYEGELPNTDAFIPYTEISDRLSELPFDQQNVVIYCRSGNMSTEAAQAMVAAGAPQFYELGGGWYSWEDAGLPLEFN